MVYNSDIFSLMLVSAYIEHTAYSHHLMTKKTSRLPTNNVPELHPKAAWRFGRDADPSYDLRNSSK